MIKVYEIIKGKDEVTREFLLSVKFQYLNLEAGKFNIRSMHSG